MAWVVVMMVVRIPSDAAVPSCIIWVVWIPTPVPSSIVPWVIEASVIPWIVPAAVIIPSVESPRAVI
jgi:hypothetical protein